MRNVVYNVLVDLDLVCFRGERVKASRDFVLTRSGYFMVVRFNNQTHFFHDQTHR
ncbi:Uncharacterised protein [Vibrio cholerae]|nr:Uncharacterised protein [Vibrio cholerae]CSD29183.1 Uncharacterised protein [Vibrio cholerae]CSD52603.1 Uncharacterised protein [Vibrio cholerae]CSI64814.1 Uncharacterised protein [Vibrio cholerae]CSI76690.1 Uncharacterised protein [Vibrio cholerae]